MPTYAILGATGATGGSILSQLLNSTSTPPITLHIFARSKDKLLLQFPTILSQTNVHFFEGSANDTSVLQASIESADVIFSCIAQNDSVPGMSIAQDTSSAIIKTLRQTKEANAQGRKPPHVIMLSAAPANDALLAKMPGFVRWLLTRAFSYVYADLRVAEQLYRDESAWLPATFVQPGGLTSGPAQGYKLHHGEEDVAAFMSYTDLGAAMIEVAHRGPDEHHDWVSVSSASDKGLKPDIHALLKLQLKGLLAHFSPALWRKCRAWGWLS